MFEGLLGDSPCHTTIRTWLAKLGLDAIKNKHISIEEAYAIILDASISDVVMGTGTWGMGNNIRFYPKNLEV